MTTTRFLFILFLLLNILLFAVGRGWLGSGRTDEAMASIRRVSIYPERIQIIAPESAQPSAEPPPPRDQSVCLTWSGLNSAQSSKLTSLLSAAGIQATTREIPSTTWRVRVPPLPTREAAEILASSIAELGLEKNSIQVEDTATDKFTILVGESFKTRAEAERQLDKAKRKGVPDAEIETRNTTDRRIEAQTSTSKVESVLAGQPFAKRYKPCNS